ncbi:MAG: hypothetical protein ACI4AQ_02945 [Lachnospiraceae bacterium]
MKKSVKQIMAVLMAVLLMITVLPVPALASQENTSKEEVVYINLNGDGSVKEINVVNIFDLDKAGKIIDYGEYDNLRNMTTTDAIEYKDNMVTIDAGGGKLYYEGKLKDNIMPWKISIRYFMDGKEYTSDEIAGMSGRMEIKMSVRQNIDCDPSFFEGYALQASFILDTNKASNIQAEGATVANVGSDKQLTYTILPNTEKDIIVSANVEDFEMSGISINGIRMNLEIDIDDATLQDKIDDVIGAVNDLDEGAGELNDGASELCDATGELNSATGELYSGVGALYDGAMELKGGLKTLTSKNSELTEGARSAYEALCSAAQTQLNAQLTSKGLEPVVLTPTTYSEVLLGVLALMDADAVYNRAYNAALSEVTSQVEAQADTLYAGYIQSQEDYIYWTYMQSRGEELYKTGVSNLLVRQMVESGGFTQEQAEAYLETPEGNQRIAEEVAALTEEEKEQIIVTAVLNLTVEQKEEIIRGAIASLTEEQKTQIRNSYIAQLMAGEEVTAKINEAVTTVNQSAAQVSELKGQLDRYGAFYNGLVDYTNGVGAAFNGATTLADGLLTLYDNTDTLKEAVGELNSAVGTLKDGTNELKEGTEKFVSETDGMNTQLEDEINSITSSLTGEDVEMVSFVSGNNTNIQSVQFVIQTENIEVDEPLNDVPEETKPLSYWEKLLRLFGI